MSWVPRCSRVKQDARRSAGLAAGPLGRMPRGGMNLSPSGFQRPPGSAVGVRLFLPSHSDRAEGCGLRGGSPAPLKTILETTTLQYCTPLIGRNK